MLCDRCGKNQASVYVKQVVNNKETVEHLCQHCAGDLFSIGNLELDKLFSTGGFGDLLGKSTAPACPLCGTTFEDFQESGRLGCSECYRTFAGRLDPMIKKIHGKSQHVGKQKTAVAANQQKAVTPDRQLQKELSAGKLDSATETKYYEKLALQKQLAELVSAENFEEAVQVRDQIKELEWGIQQRVKPQNQQNKKTENNGAAAEAEA